MFDKLMNNYYFGKSGKGDYTPDDLPATRWQLFLDTLRTRFSALIRLNLIYLLIWLPTLLVLGFGLMGATNVLASVDPNTMGVVDEAGEVIKEASGEVITTTIDGNELTTVLALTYTEGVAVIRSLLTWVLLLLIPCIAITGPFTAGVSYVTRNWSRDEHAFIWSDMKDAMKANWKQSLIISTLTSVIPIVLYVGWEFYGELATQSVIMFVPQILLLMICLVWAISVTYMHPMLITYDLKIGNVIRNSLILAIARLPMSIGIRLALCLPAILLVGIPTLLGYETIGVMLIFLYYLLIGFSLSRFITASYTNGVFDRYLNSRIEGAQVNRGLRQSDEDEEEDDEEEEEEEDEE